MKIIPVFDRAIVNPADGDVLKDVIKKKKKQPKMYCSTCSYQDGFISA